MGNVDLRQNRPDDAGQHFKSALEIYRKLAQQDPNKYQPFMAATLNTLGYADRNQNRIEQSRVHYQEAMAILRQLAQSDPSKYGGDVARVEENLKELDGKALSK